MSKSKKYFNNQISKITRDLKNASDKKIKNIQKIIDSPKKQKIILLFEYCIKRQDKHLKQK